MMLRTRLARALTVLAAAGLLAGGTALAQQGGPPQGGRPMHDGPGQTMQGQPGGPAVRGYTQAMQTMHRRMGGRLTGDPDRDFAQHMIPHHQGAIDMARVALEHGKDPDIKRIAQKVIDDQQKEIAELQDWLKAHPAKQ